MCHARSTYTIPKRCETERYTPRKLTGFVHARLRFVRYRLRACAWRRIHDRRRLTPLAFRCRVACFDRLGLSLTAQSHRKFLEVHERAHESCFDMRPCFGVCAVLVGNVTEVKGLSEGREAMFTGSRWGTGDASETVFACYWHWGLNTLRWHGAGT